MPRRQGLHLRAAAAIEASGPLDAAGVAAAALHLRLAGPLADQAKVLEQSLRASEAAAAVYAWDEAVAHLQAAFEALERAGGRSPAGRRQLGYLDVGMAMAAVFGVRTERLEVASRRALELAGEEMAGWAAYIRPWWAFNRGRLAESLSLHERTREIAGRLDDVRMGSWVAFGRTILSGRYLAGPLTAHIWCARAWHCRAWRRSRGSVTACSTISARPGAAAAGSPRPGGSPLTSTRARYWSGCCCTGRGTGKG